MITNWISFSVVLQVHRKVKGDGFAKTWNVISMESFILQGLLSIHQDSYWIWLEKMHELTRSSDYGLEKVSLEKDNDSL